MISGDLNEQPRYVTVSADASTVTDLATPDTPPHTMDEGAIIPTDHPPHAFVGRPDRWCEVCELPDRHPVHRAGAGDANTLPATPDTPPDA